MEDQEKAVDKATIINEAVEHLQEACNLLTYANEAGLDSRRYLVRELKTFIGKVDARPEVTRGLGVMNTVVKKESKFSTTPPPPKSQQAVEKLQKKSAVERSDVKTTAKANPVDIAKDIPTVEPQPKDMRTRLFEMSEEEISKTWKAEELLVICKQLGVKLEATTNKKQIIKAIKAAVGAKPTSAMEESPTEVV